MTSAAVQEANFLRQLFADMQFLDKPLVTIFVDNQSAISLAKNPVFHQRTKHIDVKFYYIRNDIKYKNVSLKYVPSESNYAYISTKPVTGMKIRRLNIFRY